MKTFPSLIVSLLKVFWCSKRWEGGRIQDVEEYIVWWIEEYIVFAKVYSKKCLFIFLVSWLLLLGILWKKKKKNILESQILHKGVTLLPELMSSKTTLGYIG